MHHLFAKPGPSSMDQALVLTLIVHSLWWSAILAYNQNPKLFVNVPCISFADQLLHGFNVILPDELVKDYLDPQNYPMIYATAVPLKPEAPAIRKLLYREEVEDRLVKLQDLEAKSWYYICIEFENMHRHHRQGNTSTTCQLYRTLDQFGKKADSVVYDSSLLDTTATSMEFEVKVDLNFEVQLDFYLEEGPTSTQSFIVDRAKPLRVQFTDLKAGFNYNRLCVHERPLLQTYTAMGRTIHVSKKQCFLDGLKTREQVDTDLQKLQAEPVRSARTLSKGAGTGSPPSRGIIGLVGVIGVVLSLRGCMW